MASDYEIEMVCRVLRENARDPDLATKAVARTDEFLQRLEKIPNSLDALNGLILEYKNHLVFLGALASYNETMGRLKKIGDDMRKKMNAAQEMQRAGREIIN